MNEKTQFDPIIGTLNEHTLHLALKTFLEPDSQYHEIPCEGYVADILRGNDIIEIETRSFSNLKKKLDRFLSNHTVTLVYPVAVRKMVAWIDPETGKVSTKRKSPKIGRPIDVMYELYKLLPYLGHPNFRLKIVLCEMDEYKRLDGWSRDKKRGATREDRVPTGFIEVIDVIRLCDYEKLVECIPNGEFTASDFGKQNHCKGRYPWYALKVLTHVGLVEQCGCRGRAYLYTKTNR